MNFSTNRVGKAKAKLTMNFYMTKEELIWTLVDASGLKLRGCVLDISDSIIDVTENGAQVFVVFKEPTPWVGVDLGKSVGDTPDGEPAEV